MMRRPFIEAYAEIETWPKVLIKGRWSQGRSRGKQTTLERRASFTDRPGQPEDLAPSPRCGCAPDHTVGSLRRLCTSFKDSRLPVRRIAGR
jgi:hypothetical protein